MEFNDPQPAIKDFNRAIDLSPKTSRLWIRRSRARQDLRDWHGAIIDLDQAIKLAPTGVSFRWRGRLKLLENDYPGAIKDAEAALQRAPGNAEALTLRAVARAANGDFQLALSDYESALAQAPANTTQLQCLRLLEQRRTRQAIMEGPLLKAGTDAPDAWTRALAQFLTRKLEQPALLQAAAEGEAAQRSERIGQAWYYAGMMRLLSGEPGPARDRFKQAAATNTFDSYEFILARAELRRPAAR
jgi:tetratricopeptide (TPR) repeat protein